MADPKQPAFCRWHAVIFCWQGGWAGPCWENREHGTAWHYLHPIRWADQCITLQCGTLQKVSGGPGISQELAAIMAGSDARASLPACVREAEGSAGGKNIGREIQSDISCVATSWESMPAAAWTRSFSHAKTRDTVYTN